MASADVFDDLHAKQIKVGGTGDNTKLSISGAGTATLSSITSTGTGTALDINTGVTRAGANRCIHIRDSGAQPQSSFYYFLSNSSSTGKLLELANNGSGNCLFIDQNGNATALNIDTEVNNAGTAINVDVNNTDGTNAFQVIRNDNVSGGAVLKLGTGYLFVDNTGDLRISGANPTAVEDGTVVGSQS